MATSTERVISMLKSAAEPWDVVESLKRLLRKSAMIVQAERVAILLWPVGEESPGQVVVDPDLLLGMQLPEGRLPADGAIAILQGMEEDSVILLQALSEFEAAVSGGRDFVCTKVQMVLRDEDERSIATKEVGVMYCFRKRYEQQYNEDDTRLLEMLADQAGALIYAHLELIGKDQENTTLRARVAALEALLAENGIPLPE